MNQLRVEYLPIDRLIPYARNSRTHSDEQVAQIAASIREWGFTNPVLVDDEGGIIAGHGRVMAARKLGMSEVPTINLGHLTETQRRAYVIADNRIALNSGWDMDMLRVELESLHEDAFKMDLLGFSANDLAIAMGVADADFEPGTQDGQSRLDEKAPTVCPACGHAFHP